jgi:nitric oxide reductase NorD protein
MANVSLGQVLGVFLVAGLIVYLLVCVIAAFARRRRRLPPMRAEPDAAPPLVGLEEVRRRLELLLAGVYGHPISIAAAAAPRTPVVRRLFGRVPPHLRGGAPLAASDGVRILLPARLDPAEGDALTRYRVMAIQQAERLARGTALALPADESPLVRDLYLLAEGAAVEDAVTRSAPGLAGAAAAERAAALARRPPPDALTPAEREVEGLVRRVLAAAPGSALPGVGADLSPAESLAWARETAARLSSASKYRGVPPVDAWGTVITAAAGKAARRVLAQPYQPIPKTNTSNARIGPVGRSDQQGDNGDPSQTGSDASDAPGQIADERGKSLMQSLDPDAAARGDRASGASARSGATAADRDGPPPGVPYPEWDVERGGYRRPGAWVRVAPTRAGDPEWAPRVLAQHAATVRRMREQFEKLRARRIRLSQQKDGEELDLAACVRAMVDLRTGHSVSDRLYAAVRPARRELAILLLLDVSGSTSEPVPGGRIIDVEKTAVLLAAEAFDALGDRYAVLSFSGQNAEHVRIRVLKDFAEKNGDEVRARVAALGPEGYTRMGAAIRHGSALLARQGTGHRLLLIVSDGKPNDDDHYQGRFAVEDTRQAIAEARAQGIFPFCLTVDSKASSYLPRIFGKAGHMILTHPEHLPLALVKVVRGLLRG